MRDFRRTFVTRGAKASSDVHAISKIMQHSDISITANVYDQVDDERQRKALKKIKGVDLL